MRLRRKLLIHNLLHAGAIVSIGTIVAVGYPAWQTIEEIELERAVNATADATEILPIDEIRGAEIDVIKSDLYSTQKRLDDAEEAIALQQKNIDTSRSLIDEAQETADKAYKRVLDVCIINRIC